MLKKIKFKNKLSERGFSLMEMIVVMFIISLGLVGILSLVIQNIQVGSINKNMLIASQLAQEGLELVRNHRDDNWMSTTSDWELGDGLDPNTDIIQDGDYAIDYTDSGLIDITGINDSAAKLYLDPDGFYRHYIAPGVAPETEFSRIIVADTDTSNASTTFQCIVQWEARGATHQYVAETILYDWMII